MKTVPIHKMNLTPERVKGINPFKAEDNLSVAKAFTQAYKDHISAPIAIREAMCLKSTFPAVLKEVRDSYLFAGGTYYNLLVGIGLEYNANATLDALSADECPRDAVSEEDKWVRRNLGRNSVGFCFNYTALQQLKDATEGEDEKQAIQEIMEFWTEESTRSKYNRVIPDHIRNNLGTSDGFDVKLAVGFPRLACISFDFDTLLRNGLTGLQQMIEDKKTSCADDDKKQTYEAMFIALETVKDICAHYEREAEEHLSTCNEPGRAKELENMADALKNIQMRKPETLREAIQLFWIYSTVSLSKNWGRMDEYFGDFYVADIARGRETEESAQALINNLWLMLSDLRYEGAGTGPNGRVIVGGKGRRNEQNADQFALAAMEASNMTRVTEPNVTLRFHKSQNPALMEKALEVIGSGCVHPGLYNDDVHIPGVIEAYKVTEAEAEQYVPQGCGEIIINNRSVGSPNSILNFVHGLDLVLHNGFDTQVGEVRGLEQGDLASFDTFDKLKDAVKKQFDFTYGILAERHKIEHELMADETALLFQSILTYDCLEKGETIYKAARYKGGIVETFGLTSLADSLYAIKHLVYETRQFTLEQIVAMLDANFDGYELERQAMLALPKFGNDHQELDDLHTELSDFMCESAFSKAKQFGLDFFLNCNLNPGGAIYGDNTKASADGRLYGDAFAMGNCPTPGRDNSGITSLLNSMAKHSKLHAGYVHNLKVSKALFQPEKIELFKTLLQTYFDDGGCQAMISVLNRDDLEKAMKEPEKYPDLLVRVAGWTARFVEQAEFLQKSIVERTFYE